MLHEFLAADRGAILSLTKEKTDAISESKPRRLVGGASRDAL